MARGVIEQTHRSAYLTRSVDTCHLRGTVHMGFGCLDYSITDDT